MTLCVIASARKRKRSNPEPGFRASETMAPIPNFAAVLDFVGVRFWIATPAARARDDDVDRSMALPPAGCKVTKNFLLLFFKKAVLPVFFIII